MSLISVTGHDPSLRHWGIAHGLYNTQTKKLTISHLDVIEPTVSKHKGVRQNSKDIEAAQQLMEGALPVSQGVNAVFIEVPVGSQGARALVSYATCTALIGAMRALGISAFELTATEVKVAAVGNKNATKKDMIQWATQLYPNAPWPYYNRHGEQLIVEGKAEHMADAIAAIHAGIKSPAFQQMLALMGPA